MKIIPIFIVLLIAISLIPATALASQKTFSVNVQEQGLPTNSRWSGYVTNFTVTYGWNTSSFEAGLFLTNGTWKYQFNDTSTYYPLNPSGYFTVDNASYTLVAQYVPTNTKIFISFLFLDTRNASTNPSDMKNTSATTARPPTGWKKRFNVSAVPV